MTLSYFSRFKRPGVVTGLAAEAACFPAPITRLHGVGLANARINSQILIKQQHDLLISAGLAGGLAADLPCGALIIGRGVLSAENIRLPCDLDIAETLANHMAVILGDVVPIQQGVVVSTPDIIAYPEDKSRLHRETGAVAVDMESGAVAQVAQEVGKPLAVLRVIADTADQTVPPSAQAMINPTAKTSIQIISLLTALMHNPGEISGLIRLAMQTRRALKTLRRCGDMLANRATTDQATG